MLLQPGFLPEFVLVPPLQCLPSPWPWEQHQKGPWPRASAPAEQHVAPDAQETSVGHGEDKERLPTMQTPSLCKVASGL